MRSEKEVKADLLRALDMVVDDAFKKLGFKRRKGSLSYARDLGEAKQTITFDADYFPKYQSDAEVHIHPAMHLSMKLVCDAALKLVAGNKMLLANAPDMILNQPIEFTAPKDSHVRWFATGISEIRQRVIEIIAFIEKWVLPFFDVLRTPEDLIKISATNDERIMKQRHWYLFIAGAELVGGNPKEALAVLESNLGAAGLRKRYAAAFEALESEI